MNRIFSVIWNHSLGAWVVASEHASRQGKRTCVGSVQHPEQAGTLRALAVAIALTLAPTGVFAADLPTGGKVVLGNGQILSPDQQQMIINQASNKLAIDWQSFNIGADKKVTFVQPGKDSVALNRVVGSDGSKIMGQLNANGQVFLVNPNGVLFSKGSSVDVGGLVASTLDISNNDFAAGNYKFEGKGAGGNASVVNQGSIKAGDGGAVALLGGTVSNQGVIAAKLGTVALAAGNKVTLDFAGDGLLNVQVDEATKNALVENQQLIQANGGQVIMTAKASDALLQTVVNNTGVIEAQTLGEKGGKIVLLGGFDGGTVQVAGTLDASAPTGGNGGFIDTSGAHVKVADSARITTAAAKGKTGNWLIDPTDYTIAATGGNTTGAAVSDRLKTTNVTIATFASGSGAGNINVNDSVVWNANTLTLTAHNNVNINKEMFGSGSAKLAVNYGQGAVAAGNASSINIKAPVNLAAGQNFSTKKGSDGTRVDYTVITSLGAMGSITGLDLQGINGALSGNFVLGANINAASTASWNSGSGFDSLGTVSSGAFTGTFDGLGHTVNNLQINRVNQDTGLFGAVGTGGVVRNVGLVNATVKLTGVTSDVFPSTHNVGALVGYNGGRIENSYASGAVSSINYVQLGGLVGTNAGTLDSSWFGGTVTDANWPGAGGLVSFNTATGVISNSYSTAAVNGLLRSTVAGLVLRNEGLISGSHATGAVSTPGINNYNAGLVARNRGTGVIINSYATGNVIGGGTAGGLVGQNLPGGQISNSYATGSVSSNGVGSGSYNGGLVGSNAGTLANVYSTGSVSGSLVNTANNGGLVGLNSGSITSAYSTGLVSSSAAGGLIGRHSDGTVTNVYYNSTVNSGLAGLGNDSSTGSVGAGSVVGLTTAQMQNRANFAGFTFSNTPGASGNAWVMVNASGSGVNNDTGGTLPMLASEYSTTITNAHQLQLMAMNLNASYVLGRDVVAGATAGSGDVWYGSFIPLGDYYSSNFNGVLDGQGHVIKNLNINLPNREFVGLFGAIGASGVVRNLGLDAGNIRSLQYVGALAGVSMGVIEKSFSSAAVTGEYAIGGLVGIMLDPARISDSYTSGAVTGQSAVGGLVGQFEGASIDRSLATGRVSGAAAFDSGGLVGTSYLGSITASFWDMTTTGQVNGTGVGQPLNGSLTGLTTAQLQNASTLRNAGWDLSNTWLVYDGKTGPVLRSFMTQLTVAAGDASKTYDGTSGFTYSGPAITDPALLGTLVVGGTSQSAINAGDYSIQLSGLYSTGQFGYAINYLDGTLTVDKRAITVSGVSVADKVYDGTTLANLTNVTAAGLVAADVGNVMLTGTYASQNAGTGIQVNLDMGGTAAGNYSLSNSSSVSGTITAKALTVSGLTVDSKTYDASTAATLSGGVLSGLVGNETLALSGAVGQFDNANAGTLKNVLVSGGTLSDGTGLASNYRFTAPLGLTGTITPKALTLSSVTASNKAYDGTTLATLSGGTLSGLLGSQTLTLSGLSGVFGDKNVGSNIGVTVTGGTLSDGSGLARNYSIGSVSGTQAAITAKAVTLTGLNVSDKVYDAGTAATLSGGMLQGLVGSETLGLSGVTGAFDTQNVGTGKTVTVTGATLVDGSGLASNYSFNRPTGLTADITAKALTVTGLTAQSKIYDGTTAAVVSGGVLNGLVGGEQLMLNTSGTFSTQDSHYGGSVRVNAAVSDGTGLASNYSFDPLAISALTADINQKTLTVTGLMADKVYDGNTFVVYSGGVLNGLVGNDKLVLRYTGDFDNKNAGTGKTVTLGPVYVESSTVYSGNYNFLIPQTITGTITQAVISGVSGLVAANKVYDGNVSAAFSALGATLNGKIAGDDLTFASGSAQFADQNAGIGKTVNVTGITLAGADLANYTFSNAAATTTANITPKALTLSGVTTTDKTYDGTRAASVAGGTLAGMVGADTLGLALSGSFADSNAGTGKSVAVAATLADGTGLASNYSVSGPTGLSASITRKALTVSGISAANKVYDATTAASLNLAGASFTGVVNGDDLSLLSASGAFSDKNAATGKTVTISGITLAGSDVGNYQWGNSRTTADISKAALTVTVADSRKPQGLGNPAFDATYQGLLGSDSVAADLTGSLAFSTPATAQSSAGQYRVSASGQSAGNYDIAYTDGLLTVDAPLLAPLETVVEVVQPMRNLPKPILAPVIARPQLPQDLYTLIDQGLRLPEGL